MQTILVILLIVAALVYLGWRTYGIFSRKAQKGCEKCGIAGDPTKSRKADLDES